MQDAISTKPKVTELRRNTMFDTFLPHRSLRPQTRRMRLDRYGDFRAPQRFDCRDKWAVSTPRKLMCGNCWEVVPTEVLQDRIGILTGQTPFLRSLKKDSCSGGSSLEWIESAVGSVPQLDVVVLHAVHCTDVDSMKKEIAMYGPIVGVVDMNAAMYGALTDEHLGHHSVRIIGYDEHDWILFSYESVVRIPIGQFGLDEGWTMQVDHDRGQLTQGQSMVPWAVAFLGLVSLMCLINN